MVAITIDANTVMVDLQNFQDTTPKAVVRALNRAIASARTVMVREMAKDTGLKSADVRNVLTMRNATANQPTATLAASFKRVPLMDFNARGPEPSRGKGRGVSYKMQGSRSQAPHAFIATMASGHRGVFERTVGNFMRDQKPTWKRKRQAIHELMGPSMGRVFAKFSPIGVAKAEAAFITNFDHEIAYRGTVAPQVTDAAE